MLQFKIMSQKINMIKQTVVASSKMTRIYILLINTVSCYIFTACPTLTILISQGFINPVRPMAFLDKGCFRQKHLQSAGDVDWIESGLCRPSVSGVNSM